MVRPRIDLKARCIPASAAGTAAAQRCARVSLVNNFSPEERQQQLVDAADHPTFAVQSTPAYEEIENDIFFVAASPIMHTIRSQIEQVARVDIPVLLLGESGVGKEVLARLVHKLSRRSRKAMVKVNCAALPADLLRSEE